MSKSTLASLGIILGSGLALWAAVDGLTASRGTVWTGQDFSLVHVGWANWQIMHAVDEGMFVGQRFVTKRGAMRWASRRWSAAPA
jgi:hypothetical protein